VTRNAYSCQDKMKMRIITIMIPATFNDFIDFFFP